MHTSSKKLVLAMLGACAIATPALAQTADSLSAFFTQGKLLAEFRYRYEHVSQDGIAHDADAQTTRLRLGLQSGEFAHFQTLIEGELTTRVAGHFNDTVNGKTNYPVVADPKNVELNRMQISYSGFADTALTLGRQRINIDTQRFIGAVGFRQNEQTFDAIRIVNKSVPNLELGYFYADRVNRVFGEQSPAGHFDGNVHAINAAYQISGVGKLSGYAYLLDLKQAPTQSTATYGVQITGSRAVADGYTIGYAAEYARQTDFARNPLRLALDYWRAELSLADNGLTLAGGLESLGGNGTVGFSTPLATLHKFQGYADTFLTTPANGVVDVNTRLTYQTAITPIADAWPLTLALTYHDFTRANGSGWLGGETDAEAALKLNDHFSFGFKYASYNGGGGFAGRDKAWISIDATY